MRKILIYLFILMAFVSNAQQPSILPSPKSDSGFAQYNYVRGTGGVIIAVRDTFFIAKYAGTLVMWQNYGVDTAIWASTGAYTGLKWVRSSSSAGGAYVKISDSSVMLYPYLRKSDTSYMLAGYSRTGKTVKYSDTSSMLSNRLKISDTSLMLSPYGRLQYINGQLATKVNYTDTSSIVSPYLRKTDTSSMLSPYYRTATATSALSGKVNYSDTALMLSNRLKITDTSTMLSGYAKSGQSVKYSDTSSMLTGYAKSGQSVKYSDTASMLSNRLKISDSTTMLSGYAKSGQSVKYSDTASMLSNRLKTSDTSLMLSNRMKITDTTTMLSGYQRTGNAKNGTVTNIATTNGILGGAITSSGTLQVDSSAYSTKANVTALLLGKLNLSDTATMLSGYKTYYPRNAISITTTGTSGAATYSSTTGVLNIPQYSSAGGSGTVTSISTGYGAIGGTITTTGTISVDSTVMETNGTSQVITGFKTFRPTVSPTSALATSVAMYGTLSATANNDTLVGLDIKPTFTPGSFTGVSNYGLRVFGTSTGTNPLIDIRQTSNTVPTWISVRNNSNLAAAGAVSADLGISGGSNQFFTGTSQGDIIFRAYSTGAVSKFFIGATGSSSAQIVLFPSSNNTGINQTTDAGYRLDVNGTARIQGNLDIGANKLIGTGGSNQGSFTIGSYKATFAAVKLYTEYLVVDQTGTHFSPPAGGQSFGIWNGGVADYFKAGANTAQTASAALEVESTTKGFLPSRMTNTQRLAISSPAVGLIVYCTDTVEGLYIYKSTGWTFIM